MKRSFALPFKVKIPRKMPWSWVFCVMVITVLALFLMGHNLFGLSKYISIVMALLGVFLAPFLTALIFPLIALFLSGLAALTAALSFFLAPVITALSSLWAWFLGTAVGQVIVAPLYNLLAPIILKIAPWLTTSRYAGKVWKFIQKGKLAALLGWLVHRHRKSRSNKA